MRDELAGRLLDQLLTWTSEEQAVWMADLRRLATHKYDDYEGFVAGERFFESLVRWLRQFDTPEKRRILITFIRKELIFISSQEMHHAIACVYPDFIRRELILRVADELGVSRYQVKRIVASNDFHTLRRKTLYLGLSDGARLDRLRRSSPELSHEQFWLSPELGTHAVETMKRKLTEAIAEKKLLGQAQFRHVVFVDDFYGSGTSLLHRKNNGDWGGKLARARTHLNSDLRSGQNPLVEEGAHITVVVYIASEKAEKHIKDTLTVFEPDWKLKVIQRLPTSVSCDDPLFAELCEWFFDDVLVDKHKKRRTPLGYGDAALPLVLHHNTPNNSVSVLWADSVDREDGERRHALFRRYERHHVDRP